MGHKIGNHIHVDGIVQGVGFRPFVFGLAQRFSLAGWVQNTSAGVEIEIEGTSASLAQFSSALVNELPTLAQIDQIQVQEIPANGFTHFEIIQSEVVAGAFQPISPDVTVCDDCLHELFNPSDRRYRYPFINCTNCGPRFTIIKEMPYDRPQTTMAPFALCHACGTEYEDPLNRRFHAQPVACPDCGPHIWLEGIQQTEFEPQDKPIGKTEDALANTQRLLAAGQIVAIKGLGGFHLACDATNDEAVAELRRRKLRRDKPFALMMPTVTAVQQHCFLNEAERALLTSRQRPIVILRRRPESAVASAVAPYQNNIGVMLPYTPLHYLLFSQEPNASQPFELCQALVMTSGNISEEPIAINNDDARQRLAGLADAFLMHNRDIRTRCDDSVMRIGQWTLQSKTKHALIPIRRSRGYAPFPVKLPWKMPPLLAVGAELKNSFCLTREQYAFLSHHIGDLENYETLCSFEDGVVHFEKLFKVKPQLLAYDLHPNYMASRYALARAKEENIPAVAVQHHHAHIAACMAEHGLPNRPLIGVAFDGTGYGRDGRIWGGEFLIADYASFERPLHLTYIPMPGGDKAVKEPWRLALAWLDRLGIDDFGFWDGHLTETAVNVNIVKHQIKSGINSPLTSSMGRLFDAAAALIGVRQQVNYEAQAAIELETWVNPQETKAYPFEFANGEIDAAPLFGAMVADIKASIPRPDMAARFHNGVAQMVLRGCQQLRQQFNLDQVVLSGGVWQNMTLLTNVIPLLQQHGFTLYWHQQVPTNDGGLALGQAVIAARKWGDVA